MGDQRTKYILLHDRVGETVERNVFSLGFSTNSTPTQVLRGALLEALPETEQPEDSTRITLVEIDRQSLRLECTLEYLTRLTDEYANLLLAISSLETRYLTFMDRFRLEFGRKILLGSKVYVSLKVVSKKLPGVVWYKGELPSNYGTMFGVELIVSIPSFLYLSLAAYARREIPNVYGQNSPRSSRRIGRKILPGGKVYVSLKGIARNCRGIVWYKGELPSNSGTMFGVELIVSLSHTCLFSTCS